jgi:hypothetical protein
LKKGSGNIPICGFGAIAGGNGNGNQSMVK